MMVRSAFKAEEMGLLQAHVRFDIGDISVEALTKTLYHQKLSCTSPPD